MRWKLVIPIVAVAFIAILVIALVIIFLPKGLGQGSRKAIIVCSANDFYDWESEDDYNNGNDATFVSNADNWTFNGIESEGIYFPGFGNETPGSLAIQPESVEALNGNFTYNWTQFYPLTDHAYYNINVSIFIQNTDIFQGKGARIGLQWLDSSNQVIRTDWSSYSNSTLNQWFSLSIAGVCNNETVNEIIDLKLVLAFEGLFSMGPIDRAYYDDVIVDRLISVNATNPVEPPPPPATKANSDGFPAQALQVYWILKNHGYTDDNIFLMLYYKNDADGIIDIDAFDIYPNDLIHGSVPAIIDVANDSVTAARFKQELNVSVSGSFASKIQSNDKLIIFMTDHGSNKVLGDGNATFHFEADKSFITEFEFYDLVKNVKVERMMINVDCCFSGNFLNQNQNIGASWYNIPNSIMISASSNVFSWYWINNLNPDGFAGSWFFHMFWDQLDQNQTIINAFNFALNFIPSVNPPRPVLVIQSPLMYDNMGINNTLSFNSIPPL